MPKLVTNSRLKNISRIESLARGRLESEGLTKSLVEFVLKIEYSNAPWMPRTNRRARKSYDSFYRRVFRSLMLVCIKNKIKTRCGFVYAIVNPNYTGWVKIGSTKDCEDRLNNYQTYSPDRDYSLIWQRASIDRFRDESLMLDALGSKFEVRNEWVHVGDHNTQEIKDILKEYAKNTNLF